MTRSRRPRAADTVPGPRKPAQTRSIRRGALVGFVLVAAALGLRIWWHSGTPRNSLSLAGAAQRAAEHPSDPDALLAYANAQLRAGDRYGAMVTFSRAARVAPSDPAAYRGLGLIAMQDNRPDYARANFVQVVRLDPADAVAWQALGSIFATAHDRNDAIVAYDHVTRLQPGNEGAWKQLGVLRTLARQLSKGHDALMRAVSLNPRDAEAEADLGNSDLVLGYLPDARRAYEASLALAPNNPTALTGDAECILELDPTTAGLSQAQRQVDQALTREPSAYAVMVRGRVSLLRRSYGRAITLFKRALAMDQDQYRAYNYLSQAYAAIGDAAAARRAAQQFQTAYARATAQPMTTVR